MPLVPDAEAKLYRKFIRQFFWPTWYSVRQCLNRVLTRRQLHRLARDLRFDLSDTPSALHFDQWLGLFRFLSSINQSIH